MRIMGPNSLGLMRPHLGLNATPLPVNAAAGQHRLHLAERRLRPGPPRMGHRYARRLQPFASLGSMIDIDFGDLIDFLGYDPHTRSIMLYMEESIGDVKKFISAARGFARNKPIVLLKPARMEAGGSRAPTRRIWRQAITCTTRSSKGRAWSG